MASTIVTSVVTGGSNNHATVSEEANAYATDFVSQGVVGAISNSSGAAPSVGGFGVSQDSSPDMGVTVNSGVAYVSGTPSSQGSQVLRARMTANYTAYTINANASGSTKYDWIYLQLSATNAANPSSAADNVITLFTSRSSSNVSDNGTPPTYGLLLAVVTVTNGASSITNGNISDRRVQSTLSNSQTSNTTGWQTLNAALTYGSNNGSKEFTVTAPTDLTSTLYPGMKLRIPRAVTPPTQSMSFVAASSQYATKASPTGITFTGAFTCEAWIYLLSYTAQSQVIINRFDRASTTGGWTFEINSSGQPRVFYGTGSTFTDFASYQAIPLNQWVHVAAVVTSVSSKTASIYINGTNVTVNTLASNSTSLTQASVDLRIGAASATPANTYFNGYLSEVRVWSTNQTQANIQANMAVNLVGNETNLVALFQGNGNFVDATSNVNSLTQSGGAIATQASNPYNTNEYATVIAASYSNPTTTITVDTGKTNTIPNQPLGTVSYSSVSNPYGLPVNLRKYTRLVLMGTNFLTAAQSPTQVLGLAAVLTIPVGNPNVNIIVYSGQTTLSASANAVIEIWNGSVGSGVIQQISNTTIGGSNFTAQQVCRATVSPLPGSNTYSVSFHVTGNTGTLVSNITEQVYLLIEVDI